MDPRSHPAATRIRRPGKPDVVVVHSKQGSEKGLTLREVAVEILTVHRGFLNWVREERVILYKGQVCLMVKRLVGRKVGVRCIPLNRAMQTLYQELIEAEMITPATDKSPAKLVTK
jgi:hypothetical protein